MGSLFIKCENGDRDDNDIDVEIIRCVGRGAFGDVFEVNDRAGNVLAMKRLTKSGILDNEQEANVESEINLLWMCSGCSFIAKIYGAKQNRSFVYIFSELLTGGELFAHIDKNRFTDEQARFCAACVVEAIEFLHSNNIVYRDLKPENIVLDSRGYCKLVDFGLAKLIPDGRANTFCGTPEFLAPEIINRDGYGKPVDWWALGVMIHNCIAGTTPFYDKYARVMYKKIQEVKYTPPTSFSRILGNFVKQLLNKDPRTRLRIDGVKDHPFFDDLPWGALRGGTLRSPITPSVRSDTSFEGGSYVDRSRPTEVSWNATIPPDIEHGDVGDGF